MITVLSFPFIKDLPFYLSILLNLSMITIFSTYK